MTWLTMSDESEESMFYARLPYDRLIMLADLSRSLVVDVEALRRLAAYCYQHDTGGLVHREVARVYVPDPERLRRLHRAALIHEPADVGWCRCGARVDPGCWSLHPPVLAAAAL